MEALMSQVTRILYFDTAATAPVAPEVMARMVETLSGADGDANPASAHRPGQADACGAAPLPYAPLRDLDVAALGAARTLVLLVIDGLGYNHLVRHGAGGMLRHHLVGRLTSVFPSTTASAITTFLTGLVPQQHALTGWHLYFREVDRIVAPLPLQPRAPGDAPAALPPHRLFAHGNLFDRIDRPSWTISPASIVRSPFNVFHAGRATR
jgi:hypothetical protein